MTTPSPAAIRLGSEWLALLREALAMGKRFRWPLRGTSMRPTPPPGRCIEIGPLPAPARVEDVIIFARDGELVAHRLVHLARAILRPPGSEVPARPTPSAPEASRSLIH